MSKATIVIPVYNKEAYLKETLISVDTQSEDDIEVLIIDDGSTDKGMDIIYDFACNTKKHARIIQNDVNRGVAYSRNVGVEEAKSDYITFLDADDLLERSFIESMLLKTNKYPFVDCINGILVPFQSNSGNFGDGKMKGYYEEQLIIPMFDSNYIEISGASCSAKMYKKSSIQNLKFVESAFEDYEFFLSTMASNLSFLYTKTAQYKYRVIANGRYQNNLSHVISFLDNFDIYDRLEQRFPNMDPGIHEAIRNKQISICIRHLRLLLELEMMPLDEIAFIQNYLQYLKVRYSFNHDGLTRFFDSYPNASNDVEVLKKNLKQIILRYS